MNSSIIQTGFKNIKMLPKAFQKLKNQFIGLRDNAIENQTPIKEKVNQKFKKVVGAKEYLDFSNPKAGMTIQEMNRLELLYKGLVKSALAIPTVPFLMEYVGTGLIKINAFLWHHLGENAKEFLHNCNVKLNECLGNKYTFDESTGKWLNDSYSAVNLTGRISDKLNAIVSGAVTTAGLTLGGIGVVKGFKAIKNKVCSFFKDRNKNLDNTNENLDNNNGNPDNNDWIVYDNVNDISKIQKEDENTVNYKLLNSTPQLNMPRPALEKDNLENSGWVVYDNVNDIPPIKKEDEYIDNFEQPQFEMPTVDDFKKQYQQPIDLGINTPKEEDISFDLETEPKEQVVSEQPEQNIENPMLNQIEQNIEQPILDQTGQNMESPMLEEPKQNIILEKPLYIHNPKPIFSDQEKEQLNTNLNDELKYKLEDNYNYLNEKAMNSYIKPEEKAQMQAIQNDFNRLDNVNQNALTSDAVKYSIYAELETLDSKEYKTPSDIERMKNLNNMLKNLGQKNQEGGRIL